MKKRFASILAAAVVATGLSTFGAVAPASAHSTCAAQGTVTLGAPIGTTVVFPNVPTTFNITSSGGTCGSVIASGSGSFSCGSSSGSGSMTIGGHSHSFTFSTAATVLTGSGGVSFTGNAVPDPTGGSCATGSATRFIVTVAIS